MTKTIYISLSLNNPQTEIMKYIEWWVHNERKPIPFKKILKKMLKQGIKEDAIKYSIRVLLKENYIRRSEFERGNGKTSFVKLRSI